jgi:hypothetical protein
MKFEFTAEERDTMVAALLDWVENQDVDIADAGDDDPEKAAHRDRMRSVMEQLERLVPEPARGALNVYRVTLALMRREGPSSHEWYRANSERVEVVVVASNVGCVLFEVERPEFQDEHLHQKSDREWFKFDAVSVTLAEENVWVEGVTA